jgi:macrolide transport system ATP-binding/permease protein
VSEPSVLVLRDIAKVFDGGATVALSGASLEVMEGDFVSISGPSGAGKSTLLNIVGLLDAPSSGEYLLDGVTTMALTERQKDIARSNTFGFVFQAAHVLPYESVAQNAALGLAIQGLPINDRIQRVTDALNRVGLLHRANALARSLSGGERQRLAIARAIATNPTVLLADEPTGNLDSENSILIMDLLSKLNDQGMTVLVITHDERVAAYASKHYFVRDGCTFGEPGTVSNRRFRSIEVIASAPRIRILLDRTSDAIAALTSRPSRTAAVLCAFLLGVGGLVAATGISASASAQVSDRLAEGALDSVYVTSPAGKTQTSQADMVEKIEALQHVVDTGLRVDVDAALANVRRFGLQVDDIGKVSGVTTIAANSSYLNLVSVDISPGAAASALDDLSAGAIALVGVDAAEVLDVSVGQQVWVLGRAFTVVGEIESPGRLSSLSSSLIIPTRWVPDLSSTLLVRTELGYPAALADAIPIALAPDNPGSISVSTVADLRNLRMGVASDLGTLVALVSILLLLLAVLSAGTSMYLVVQSRRQELALRRALGLSRRGVAAIFIIEGCTIGIAGGAAGVALGICASVVVAASQGWSAVLPWGAPLVGLAVGLLGGAISSVFPAIKAAGILPAEAIR